ncbi:cupredoxin domain-containing protein [Methanoregula sp.]|uniref:cupredoxin domain-containing protein n=1 Tax=Methanoregula sp. TaxID=2052170 RepID=UPI002639B518|nr:cupredoxin domain-containing protein [Methanoregula sp.]MDD5142525.1 cupredoxin domain-containing protein [Methanoregula sp.]
MQKWFALIALVAVLMLVSGCVQETSPEPSSTPVPATTVKQVTTQKTPLPVVTTIPPTPTLTPSTFDVYIYDTGFSPKEITVKVGSQVRWVNVDEGPHRVSFVTGGFSEHLLGPSGSMSQMFIRPGIYDYRCKISPTMQGRVTVLE